MVNEQDLRISETVIRERTRLRNFIRRRVPDRQEAEDILQEVFSELVEAYRLIKPIENAGAWLYRVARNRIADVFRKNRPQPLEDQVVFRANGESLRLQDLLPSPAAGPEEQFQTAALGEQLEEALDELPADQRAVFIAHEIEGRSFKELSQETGLSVNTLLSRKHYAVIYLRKRLREAYGELESTRR